MRSIIKCDHCRCDLGETDGDTLYLDKVKIEKIVTLRCACCGLRRTWRPALAEGERICYTGAVPA